MHPVFGKRSHLAFAALFALATTGCPTEKPSSTKDAGFKVAGNLPLTGPIAAFCGQYPNGFEMGLEAAAGERKIDTANYPADFQDNAGKPETAVTVLQGQLSGTSPRVYISGTTQMTEAILPQLNKLDSLHFLVSFDAFMTHGAPKVYRVLPNFKIEAPLFVNFIKHKKAKKVFFFTPNLKAYLEQSDKLILPPLKESGIDHQRELFEFKHKDYRPIAEKAAKYEPDVIVVSGYSFHLLPILRALREFGLVKKCAVLCTLDYIDLLRNDTPRTVLENISFTAPHCEIPGKVEGYEAWTQAFEKRYGKKPSYVDAYGYDTARLLVAAHAGAGKLDDAAIRAVLPFNGIVGKIALDPEGDLESTLTIGYLNSEGKVEEPNLD